MALNLSTLTSPATSGNVLEEITTTADFLESVPVLRNLARGSNAGGDAKQSVALNQPKALPLIKNPAGDLGGYLYIPNASGNYATGPSVTIGSNETWEGEVDMVITQFDNYILPFGGGDWTSGFGLLIYATGYIRVFSKSGVGDSSPSGITLGTPVNVKYGFDGTNLYVDVDDTRVSSTFTTAQSNSITHTLELNQQTLALQGNYAIQKAKLTVNNAVVFDCDFNGSTSIRHGDTKFQAAVGGAVTINQSGNDPCTIIKKPVLRFDGVNGFLTGLLNQTITEGGYAFAAFSVLGDGGEDWARVLSFNPTGGDDFQNGGQTFIIKSGTTNDLSLPTGTDTGMFDDANGDILVETARGTNYSNSRVNDASVISLVAANSMSFDEFNLGASGYGTANGSIDLEYLAVFPATLSDSQADQIRNYINNRNKVFYRWDTDGYYFFDAASTTDGEVLWAQAWNGRIVGSDNGDADMFIGNGTAADRPTTDGYKITFADNTDHFDIPSTSQAGWQIVGTSLGTFAYKVNGTTAVTELNLLGNFGSVSYRQAGDLYGIILLPESATGREIEQARKLLIDRGAADGTTPTSLYNFWRNRSDIVQFNHINTSSVTSYFRAWRGCSELTSFPLLDHNNAVDFREAFYDNTNLESFPAIQATNCVNFTSAWQNCSALTSFPENAKLGTEATNVNFQNAWRSSGLTSFSTPLPTATNTANAWLSCTSLTIFSSELPQVTNVSQSWYSCTSLTIFSLELPSVTNATYAWYNCFSLTDFSADVFSNWNPSSIPSGIFNEAWDGCTSLTAQSVENILVPIDSSGKHATSDGTSGGTPLADAGIDIDYDTSTGTLTAATLSAIDSLSGKGWQVYINGELVIPNILDLQPAAAYSLRSFDADADPNVVNVRRSSDGATSDFTASEVSDGTLEAWVGSGNDGYVTTWYDQKIINETGDAYGTTISGTADGTSDTYVNLAPAVAGEYYRVRYTLSNLNPRGRVRFRTAANNADLTAVAGTAALSYIYTDGSYETVVPSDDGLSLWFTADAGQSFDYSGISVQQVDNYQNNSTQSTASAQPLIVQNGVLVTENGEAALSFDEASDQYIVMSHSDLYGQSRLDSFYVTSTSDDTYLYPARTTSESYHGLVAVDGSTSSYISGTNYGTVSAYANNTLFTGTTRDEYHAATSGYKLISHENAQTVGWDSLNFGRYGTAASIYSYTGKLQEMIFFNTDQSANRAAIETNINDHFGIY